jgi:hypothetical protein
MYIIWKVRHWLIQKELESPVLGRKYLVGKSGAWPKIFGWKLEKVWKIFGLKLEKY